MIPALLFAMACAPRYAQLGPIEPKDLWTPLPVQHVDVDGSDVAFVDSGGHLPALVMIHGLSSYGSFWEYQVADLQKDFRVLALDLPGYGQSGKPDAPYTPTWYADRVSDWMDAIGLPHAFVVGHSMGGRIACELALRHPQKVEKLVLSAPAGFEAFSAGAGDFMKSYWTEARATESSEEQVRANFVAMVFNRTDDGVERLIEERVRWGQSASFASTSVAVSRSIAGMIDEPLLDRAKAITQPTLIVFGTDDKMIPNPVFTGGPTRAIAEAAHRTIPGSKLLLVPGAGHTVHHDAPETFDHAVREFLAP